MLVDTSLYKCLLFVKPVVLEIVVDLFNFFAVSLVPEGFQGTLIIVITFLCIYHHIIVMTIIMTP